MELESQISDTRERLEEEEGTTASLSATKRKLEGELSDLRWDLEGLETTLAKTEKEKQVGRPWGPSPVPSQDRGTAGLALQGHSRSPHSGAALDPSHPATHNYFNFIQCCFKRGSCVDLATFPGLSSLV